MLHGKYVNTDDTFVSAWLVLWYKEHCTLQLLLEIDWQFLKMADRDRNHSNKTPNWMQQSILKFDFDCSTWWYVKKPLGFKRLIGAPGAWHCTCLSDSQWLWKVCCCSCYKVFAGTRDSYIEEGTCTVMRRITTFCLATDHIYDGGPIIL